MNIKHVSKRVRNTALVIGAAALVPLSAQAMVEDHDMSRIEVDTNANVDKTVDGEPNRALALRFGAYSAIGTNAISTSNTDDSAETGMILKHLP